MECCIVWVRRSRVWHSSPKGCNKIAQGNALGKSRKTQAKPCKGETITSVVSPLQGWEFIIGHPTQGVALGYFVSAFQAHQIGPIPQVVNRRRSRADHHYVNRSAGKNWFRKLLRRQLSA